MKFCCNGLRSWVLLFAAFACAPLASVQQARWKQLNQQVLDLDKSGNYNQALLKAKEALKVAEASFHPGDWHIAIALGNLARVYTHQNDYASAEPLDLRALDIVETALGPDAPEVAPFLGNLAAVYSNQSNFTQAEVLYQRVIRIDEKALGRDSPDLAVDLNDLGALYFREGQYAKAQPFFERALAMDEKAHGAESLDVSLDLANLGLTYDHLAKYADAEPLLNSALAIDEKRHGENHPDVGMDLINLGTLYVDQGRFKAALPSYQRALHILETALGPEDTNMAIAATKLGMDYDYLGRYADARPLVERAVHIDEKALGPSHPNVAVDLHNLATVYQHLQLYSDAQPLFERALTIDEKFLGPDHPDLAALLEDLGDLFLKEAKYDLAESLDKRAIGIEEKAHGSDHPDVANALSALANLYDYLGRYADAEELHSRALTIRERSEGSEHIDVANSLYNLATLFVHQGKYAEAEPFYLRALAIKEKVLGPDHPEVAADINNLATIYYRQGKYSDAEQLYQRALSIDVKALGPEDPGDAIDLNNLALVYLHQNKLRDAEDLFKRALAIDEKALGPDRHDVAMCLNNLAGVEIAAGKFADAEPLIERAIKIDEKEFGPDNAELATDLNSLAVVYSKQARYRDAEPLFQRILAIHEKVLGPDHPSLATDFTNFGLLYEYQGKYAQADPLFQRSLDNVFKQFQYNFTYMTEKERLGYLDMVADDFPAYLSFVHRFHDKDPQLIGSMYNLLLWEKGSIAGSVADMRRQIEAAGDEEALKLVNQLTERRTQIASLLNVQPPDRDAWRKQLDQLRAEADQTEKALVARSAAFAERKRLDRASWQEVRDALKPGDAAVEIARFRYYEQDWTDKSYYAALIVTHETKDQPQYIFLGDDKQIEGEAITHFQQQLRTRGLSTEPEAAALPGQEAYALIWKPLEPALAGVKRVYVSPDGVLNQIPLGIIAAPDGKLTLEKYDLRLLSSTRDILRTHPAPTAGTALLVGNPVFALSEDQQRAALAKMAHPNQPAALSTNGLSRDAAAGTTTLPTLPGTGAEVAAIADLMQQHQWKADVYTGDAALKSVVERAASPRVIHLATHGFFLPDQQMKMTQFLTAHPEEKQPSGLEDPMLRSGLYFSGADRTLQGKASPLDLDNGVLTALEAANLNLQGTDLVVLSACNTGQGDVKNGEGVFGLRRALEEAGAHEVLMSLWSVPDQETLELMKRFYTNWLSGMEVHESLRQAQLAMRNKVKTAHDGRDLPYYWGAFVLVGP